MEEDVEKVDLLIVMGSSLQVGPVNSIPDAVPQSVPTILSELYKFKGPVSSDDFVILKRFDLFKNNFKT